MIGETFDYTREAFHQWAPTLKKCVEMGAQFLTVPVLWGNHEPTPGVYDFAGSPRLRFEKLLSLAAELKIPLDIQIGFPPDSRSVPLWVKTESRSRVSGAICQDKVFAYSVSDLPFLYDDKLLASFEKFAEEILRLLSLYIPPNGSLRHIYFEPGVYALDSEVLYSPKSIEMLKKRHSSIEHLNDLYRASFRDLRVFCSSTGRKSLAAKNEWLFAYDYKYCRQQLLQLTYEKLKSKALRHHLTLERLPNDESLFSFEDTNLKLILEGTLLEKGFRGFAPLAITELLGSASTIEFYRIASLLLDTARTQHVESAIFTDAIPTSWLDRPTSVIFCGTKFLKRSLYQDLIQSVERGGRLFLVNKGAVYDEERECLRWGPTVCNTTFRIGGVDFTQKTIGQGVIFEPLKEIPVDANYCEQIFERSKELT